MFTYTAKTNGQSMSYRLEPGYYRARIHEAEETRSKAGADMVKLTLWVEGPEGYCTINEYLVNMDSTVWKIDQFMSAIGREVEPGKQLIVDANQLIGKTCWVKTIEEESEKEGKTYINPRVERFMREDKVPDYILNPQTPAQTTPRQQGPTHFGYDSKGRRVEGNSPSTMKPVAQMPHEDEDDIPF